MLQFIGFFTSIIMAIGCGICRDQHDVRRRRQKIARDRHAAGAGLRERGAILRSFIAESICLALIGGIVGIAIALPLNNVSAGVGNWQTFSEMAFKFKIDQRAIFAGLLFAAVIGALGGFLPAWSASKKNIVMSMREG